MARPHRTWTVTPHNAIEKLEDNLWSVESPVPNVPMTRRMCIVRLADGRLLFYHAIPLDDAALAEVRAWGKPTWLVIGHDAHGLDATAFQQRLGLKLLAPKTHADRFTQKGFALDGALEEFPADASVRVESVRGARNGESLVVVKSGGGARVSVLFSDVFINVNHASLTMRLSGFSGGPKVPLVFRLFMMKDKQAVRAHLESLAATPHLARLVPCHGEVVTDNAAETLRAALAKV